MTANTKAIHTQNDQFRETARQTGILTICAAAQIDEDTAVDALAEWVDDSQLALAAEENSVNTAQTSFEDQGWTSWLNNITALLNADQTDVTQTGQSALQVAPQVVTIENDTNTRLANAAGDNARAQTTNEWTWKIAEAQIKRDRTVAQAQRYFDYVSNPANDLSAPNAPLPVATAPYSPYDNAGFLDRIVLTLERWTGGESTEFLTSPEFGKALNATDQFFAGMGDSVSFGLSTRARSALYGQTATQNHQGQWFTAGQVVGGVVATGIGFGNPCSMTTVGRWGFRGIQALQAAGGSFNMVENISKGNFGMAALDALGVLGNFAGLLRACYIEGTPVLTPDGQKRIELFKRDDLILAQDENDPNGPVTVQKVLDVFTSTGQVLHMHARGRVIGTTAEHPHFVKGKGWIPAGEIQPGDQFRSHDRQWVTVEDIYDTGEIKTVYNVRVSEHHTYFVGERDWGFSVWAHNTCDLRLLSWIAKHMLMGTERHHAVFLSMVRAFERFSGVTTPIQKLVTLTRNLHQDFLHPLWKALNPSLTSTRKILQELRSGAETPGTILDKLASFYRSVIDDPAILKKLLDEISAFRSATGH